MAWKKPFNEIIPSEIDERDIRFDVVPFELRQPYHPPSPLLFYPPSYVIWEMFEDLNEHYLNFMYADYIDKKIWQE